MGSYGLSSSFYFVFQHLRRNFRDSGDGEHCQIVEFALYNVGVEEPANVYKQISDLIWILGNQLWHDLVEIETSIK